MTDRYLDKTEVVSVIYYSDNKQTCTASHMFIFLQLTRHRTPTTPLRRFFFHSWTSEWLMAGNCGSVVWLLMICREEEEVLDVDIYKDRCLLMSKSMSLQTLNILYSVNTIFTQNNHWHYRKTIQTPVTAIPHTLLYASFLSLVLITRQFSDSIWIFVSVLYVCIVYCFNTIYFVLFLSIVGVLDNDWHIFW